jgi:hypothetical protein
MKKPAIWIGLGLGAVFALMMYLSLRGVAAYRVEVCMEFRGQSVCRTASGAAEADTLRAATDNACALLASGMTDSIACQNTPPVSVKWLEGK